jgi:hypothetical protein
MELLTITLGDMRTIMITVRGWVGAGACDGVPKR